MTLAISLHPMFPENNYPTLSSFWDFLPHLLFLGIITTINFQMRAVGESKRCSPVLAK